MPPWYLVSYRHICAGTADRGLYPVKYGLSGESHQRVRPKVLQHLCRGVPQAQPKKRKRRQIQIADCLQWDAKSRETRTNARRRRQTRTNAKLKNYSLFDASPFAAPQMSHKLFCGALSACNGNYRGLQSFAILWCCVAVYSILFIVSLSLSIYML